MITCKLCENKCIVLGLCKKHYDQQRYKNNPEYNETRCKKYYSENIEHCKKIKKIWYKNNIKKCRKRSREHIKNHPESMLKAKKKQLIKLGKMFDMTSKEMITALLSWSSVIKKLDNFRCKNCGSTHKLNAHHIQPKSEFPELSLDLDNGVTLCEDCHGETHGFKIY